MSAFDRIRPALLYIDAHLDASLRLEDVAARFHFSPFYFHRMFTLIVGTSLAAYIRRRRMEYAALWLAESDVPLVEIALRCGFESSQAFSRAFRRAFGMPPGVYRKRGVADGPEPVEALIRRFTNRLQGGMLVHPKIIWKERLRIAGSEGSGHHTGQVWSEFEGKAHLLGGKKSDHGFEVRVQNGAEGIVYVGNLIAGKPPEGFAFIELPAGEYASFEVFVAEGYESENDAMNRWLAENTQRYRERLLDGKQFVVEFYDERFQGEESGSIVEIWVPIEKA